MPLAGLRIDTSVPKHPGPTSGKGRPSLGRGVTPSSARSKSSLSVSSVKDRMRSPSSASTSSTLSLVTPPLSSDSNASTASLHVPQASTSSSAAAGPSRRPTQASTPSSAATSPRTSSEFVLAMHDYVPQSSSGTYLSFRAGQIIRVLNRDASGWWDGELDGRRGWFPSNYVSAHVSSLTEEELPSSSRWRPGHAHTQSTVSTTSWASTPSPRHNRFSSEIGESEFDSYCPPLMVPLLHGMSVLQASVRSNRPSHFQPSTASIIVSVRTMLSSVECLQRDAPRLKQHPPLAQERAQVLATLAALVAQTKKAGEETEDEERAECETESMLKLAGHLFAHCRRFLAVAAQCGVPLPDRRSSASDQSLLSEGEEAENRAKPARTTNGIVHRPQMRQREVTATPRAARSMGDLRTPRQGTRRASEHGHHGGQSSISSISSTSSSSSSQSIKTPPMLQFPTGPTPAAQVLDALRHTHDQYLSTIAAFIGHAHSHSRMSHASSTGHMYDLVREVVDMVCKLLTIVEAVMQHPALPPAKLAQLRGAREGLYSVTTALADAVRMLTSASGMSEEEEKAALLRSATGALKAGADCVAAVKLFLNRTAVGDRGLVVHLPGPGQTSPVVSPRTKAVFEEAKGEAGPAGMLGQRLVEMEDEDMTIQARTISTDAGTPGGRGDVSHLNGTQPSQSPPLRAQSPRVRDGPPVLPPLDIPDDPPPQRLQTPSLLSRTDDGTTWEGSHHQEGPRGLEEKLLNGELPSIPSCELPGRDPLSWMLSHDYSLEDVAYNSDGHLVGASLNALVEKMTPHDSLVDITISDVFWGTFRLFSSPAELLDAIIARYNLQPPPNLSQEDVYVWQQRKGMPVRLRVSNLITKWLEANWRASTDKPVLPALAAFNRDALSRMFPGPAQRIQDLIVARSQDRDLQRDRLVDRSAAINPPFAPPPEIPRPVMNKSLLSALRNKSFTSIAITDFDPTELARQLTLMECNLYCAIRPEELLEIGQEGTTSHKNIKAVTSLSTVITGWVAESILNELDMKKRVGLVKFFIKVADRCSTLNNFSTSRSILAALDSSTISRLHQTWMGVPQKNKLQLESLRKLADHARNYHEYRSRLRNTAPPAVPFLGLYLTDITFCREGNPSHRASPLAPEKKLLNFNKYHKLHRIVQDMVRFQVPYNLKDIPEAQEYLHAAFERSKSTGDLQDLYRRSLLVEPRQPADTPPASDVRHLFTWASRSQSQQATPAS
ncbi:ras GEF [Gloeophyllum trabeum ATCC 11539]|uniref:Ras GEF n=1 Tax=Gloeophyllum trabeum (strain ATCC 11539 / FP-39264 / Madison 617) TaxID=670483 RepID=S7Q4P6_GLOTA|nr:ras GEF [Gloeophyllum trabeum ATCC 11539]EPQ54463.1 ras GEF [Gloeophyllum trabeum ATCC 11539]